MKQTTVTTVNTYEETHAARCLHIYVNNESEIYFAHTVPAIETATAAVIAAGETPATAQGLAIIRAAAAPYMSAAITAAARLVRKYDGLRPTAEDKAHVMHNLFENIVEDVIYNFANA